MKHLHLPHTNIAFLNERARKHYLDNHINGLKVIQLHSDLSPGFFYTYEGYETMCNLMSLADYETHTATEWDAGMAAMYTDKVFTKEDVIAEFEMLRRT